MRKKREVLCRDRNDPKGPSDQDMFGNMAFGQQINGPIVAFVVRSSTNFHEVQGMHSDRIKKEVMDGLEEKASSEVEERS